MKGDGNDRADLVLLSGSLYTMDALRPRAEGVAIKEIGRASCRERV